MRSNPWWKRWSWGHPAVYRKVDSSPVGTFLGMPRGHYQVEAESWTEQVNRGSYRGEIKDGGHQTSTFERQSLAGTKKQASGDPDWGWRWERELLTGGDHRLGDGEGAHKCESPLSVWTQGSYLNSLCLLSFTVRKDAGGSDTGSTDSEGSCRGWVRNYKWSTLSQCLAWRTWPFNVSSYYQDG